jgi:organic hydroperoxide reductase OsmC/OhrA
MSEHKATIRWNRDGKDYTYKTYSRDHTWSLNGNAVPASATPAYLGNPQRVDPEAAFVAALSSCHMLTFLAVAATRGFVVESYEDEAVGHLEKNAAGKMAVTRVELHPKVVFGGSRQPAAADLDALHDKAHKECFIANSVTTDVKVAGHGSS